MKFNIQEYFLNNFLYTNQLALYLRQSNEILCRDQYHATSLLPNMAAADFLYYYCFLQN